MIEYQEYTKLNNYNKQDKILSKLAVRYPNRFSDSLPRCPSYLCFIKVLQVESNYSAVGA